MGGAIKIPTELDLNRKCKKSRLKIKMDTIGLTLQIVLIATPTRVLVEYWQDSKNWLLVLLWQRASYAPTNRIEGCTPNRTI
jgi:hypothetical protein